MPEITKKTQLAWLDKQRSIVNDMVVNLSQNEQRKLLPELQVINAIAERVKEMTAVEYLEIKHKICVQYIERAKERFCVECPLDGVDHTNNTCAWLANKYPRRAVEIVKRWKEEQDGNG